MAGHLHTLAATGQPISLQTLLIALTGARGPIHNIGLGTAQPTDAFTRCRVLDVVSRAVALLRANTLACLGILSLVVDGTGAGPALTLAGFVVEVLVGVALLHPLTLALARGCIEVLLLVADHLLLAIALTGVYVQSKADRTVSIVAPTIAVFVVVLELVGTDLGFKALAVTGLVVEVLVAWALVGLAAAAGTGVVVEHLASRTADVASAATRARIGVEDLVFGAVGVGGTATRAAALVEHLHLGAARVIGTSALACLRIEITPIGTIYV